MLTRIMCVGPGRLYEAAAVLSFDYNLATPIDQTIVVSPASEDELKYEWNTFDIDLSRFKFLQDHNIDLPPVWQQDPWYRQQAIKLHLLDSVDSDDFLIQDCDVIPITRCDLFSGSTVHFKVEGLWNPYQKVYADAVRDLIGFDRQVDCSFVSEFMPYHKQDWLDCQQLLGNWQQRIPEYRIFDHTKWFSEYELLGIYKTNVSSDYTVQMDCQNGIFTWQDLETNNWSITTTCKFKDRPLKFMTPQQAHDVVDFFRLRRNGV
jgi:hypothetical protein